MERYQEIERSIIKKYRKEIWCKFTTAINDYQLLQQGDRIAVCISGGKDSMLCAKLLQEIKRHGKFDFRLEFIVMDPGYNKRNREQIEYNARLLNIPIKIFESNIFSVVEEVKDSPCYLCARMRRGHLYAYAKELGCNKIALGHHFDDVIETTMMSMLYSGQMKSMMPKLHSTNFPGMELIRPMYLIKEEDIIRWQHYNQLTFIQCACRFTENLNKPDEQVTSKRDEMKSLIKQLRTISPFIDSNIFRSTHNVNLDTMIGWERHHKKYSFLDEYNN
ncbi:MAG TPA: tRNA 2-thiocytidine biosynthesis protein TtcA [Candidatus Fimimorpha faecalis]|uniref:tRNA 2-thiocytidine biosynthesis protein TtcA n=1 Tax=Candidatus Fimimorpha faecalis TaxID=2840824 RepID=A0A9D1EEF8_9FIRM|nr:tRNA 2-thiocytidine biosynthesis protein TtcA [Candidatus Fimimorpha faecalis]